MAKQVDLLKYWHPILRNIKEFKEIANAEKLEIEFLLQALEIALKDRFIEKATESGISRYEKLLKINSHGEDLEDRRVRVKNKWRNKLPYTLRVLLYKLDGICGEGNYQYIDNFKEYQITIITRLEGKSQVSLLKDMLIQVMPANIVVVSLNNIFCEAINTQYMAVGLASCEIIELSNDFKDNFNVDGVYNLASGVGVASEHSIYDTANDEVSINSNYTLASSLMPCEVVMIEDSVNVNATSTSNQNVACTSGVVEII